MTTSKNSAMMLTLPSGREIALTRVFDAPRALVWEAITRPEHVTRWWGLRGSTMPVCEMDLRAGGSWRYVVREAGGSEIEFYGVYREIVAPERMVYTEIFAPYPDNPGLNTLTLEERDGKTTLTSVSLYESVEVRDMVLQSGMETGAAETYDRLAELLQTMA